MKRGIHPRETTSTQLSRISYGLLSLVILLTIGCSSRQNINVKSEGLPPDQRRGQAMAEPESPKFIDSEEEDQISEFPLPGDQLAEDKTPPPVTRELKEVSPPPDKKVSPIVVPVPLIKEKQVDLSNVPRTVTDIFFDYDQYRIRQDAITVLEVNAKVLTLRYPDKKVVIQGHCDERGTREYNLILGERRALAVKNYLIDLGVPEKNMQVISYGKEKPFCIEHSKKCWQKNRRSHFVIN
ncbi:MAG: peptidoglycan-associated lipoprotein Pal [Nitrospirota bacterium]|nr:MAG: peptidoglycan-associated lipoprotein Pal [Nitrospirota bacterium]